MEKVDWRGRFVFTLTIAVVLGVYSIFDAVVLDPKGMADARAIIKDEMTLEMESRLQEKDIELKAARQDAQVEWLEERAQLQRQIQELQLACNAAESERLAAKQAADDARLQATRATGGVDVIKAQRDDAVGRLEVAERTAEGLQRAVQGWETRYQALRQQQQVLFDGFVEQLVKLKNDAPAKVPETYKEEILEVVRRIRAAQQLIEEAAEAQAPAPELPKDE